MRSNLRVVTLAAGHGSRLGIGPQQQAKFMTELGGKTLLDWQRIAYEQARLHERLLVVRPEAAPTLEPGEHCVHVSGIGGPMDSLFAIDASAADNGLIVSYADIVFHPEIVTSLLAVEQSDICIVADRNWLALWSLRFDSVLDDAEPFQANGNSLIAIGGQATDPDEIEAQFIGMMKLSPHGFQQLKELSQVGDDTTKLLARALATGIHVDICYIDGRWCEVDTQRDITCYQKAIDNPARWPHDWRGH